VCGVNCFNPSLHSIDAAASQWVVVNKLRPLSPITYKPKLDKTINLAVPAAGALVTLPGVFHAAHVEATLTRLASELARGMRGPSQDCAHCGWRDLCRVGKLTLRNPAAESDDV
jgi:hypothetical protein